MVFKVNIVVFLAYTLLFGPILCILLILCIMCILCILFTWVHFESLGFPLIQLGSLGYTWWHLVDLGDVRDLLSKNKVQFWEEGLTESIMILRMY